MCENKNKLSEWTGHAFVASVYKSFYDHGIWDLFFLHAWFLIHQHISRVYKHTCIWMCYLCACVICWCCCTRPYGKDYIGQSWQSCENKHKVGSICICPGSEGLRYEYRLTHTFRVPASKPEMTIISVWWYCFIVVIVVSVITLFPIGIKVPNARRRKNPFRNLKPNDLLLFILFFSFSLKYDIYLIGLKQNRSDKNIEKKALSERRLLCH